MGTLTYTVPVAGTDLNSVADPEIATALTTILTWANGNIDAVNLSNLLAQSVGANLSGQTVKGTNIVSGAETRTNTAYGTMPTADQVTGIVLPANGLIAVQYQALWQQSVSGAARAAIFVGSNQLVVQAYSGSARGPLAQAAAQSSDPTATGKNVPLFTVPTGLASAFDPTAYSADAATGQATGFAMASGINISQEVGGVVIQTPTGSASAGGWCLVDGLPAGTYTVGVQFKASSGSVTASGRRLRVMALSFS